jgi:hypothetical protein
MSRTPLSVEAMKRLNWKIIKSNISEAREELQKVESLIESGDLPDEGELQIMVEHAYHHINFAWNARKMSTRRYANLADTDFNSFGKFPEDLEEWHVSDSEKRVFSKTCG